MFGSSQFFERRHPINLLALLLTGGLICSIDLMAEDYWVADPDSGCRVWSDEAVAELTVRWSGRCEGDRAVGEGQLDILRDGKKIAFFSGVMLDGKASGNGVYEIIKDAGMDRYTGGFEAGRIQGYGVYETADGRRFEGQFADGLPNVFGRYEDSEGLVYLGEIENGLASGVGSETWPDGERYDGQFQAGDRNGLGSLRFSNGDLYFGQFANDLPDGNGSLQRTNGSSYQGEFLEGLAAGYGTYIDVDDVVYQGHFASGKADGVFLVTKTDGSTELQTWRNDERVE
jgi:hypothetical protein